jgi:2-amino-4-hydroxy-6-hydroxymethyldihydropteridine diphosphokinase
LNRETEVYLSLGANLGDRQASLARARLEIGRLKRTAVQAASQERMTEPVGLLEQSEFLNQVLRLSTELEPLELLERLLEIERSMGRVRSVRWGPRVIDIDILFYGRARIDTGQLVLPHPEIWNRSFFLEMVAEIDSRFLDSWEEYGREED